MRYITGKYLLTFIFGLTGTLFMTTAGFSQEFIDGEFMEGGMDFTPDFIEPEELLKKIEAGDSDFVLVDNAPAMAYEEEHIPGAISYPWVRAITPPVTLPRNKTLVLYCPCAGDDADSIDMTKKLRQFGYFRTKVLEGGWFKWLELGYPIVEAEYEEDA
jgi:rhodanese-related sulfurtransferase